MWFWLAIALAADPSRAETLAALRAEVALLSADLEAADEAAKGDLRSLSAQQAELELQVRREEVRIERIEERIARERDAIALEDTDGVGLVDTLRVAMDRLRRQIETGLPYRVGDRLGAVDALAAQLDGGEVRPRQVAVRLWSLYEDEDRLTRENALDRQVIPLDGAERLVSVARLGMVALYLHTDDGRAGPARRTTSGWTWVEVTGADARAVDTLFASLRQRVRTGWFDLPAFPGVTP